MNFVVLSIGSNSSDREWQMKQALNHLNKMFKKCVASETYEFAAHNGIDAPYLNQVVLAKTLMPLEDINVAMKQWETICGRTPSSKQQGVIPIDIDIVIFNGEMIKPVDYSRQYVYCCINNLLSRLV